MRSQLRALGALLAVFATLPGCEAAVRAFSDSPEERLVSAVLEAWAEPGRPFLGGEFSGDTVGRRTENGDGTWSVSIPDAGIAYSFEVLRADLYRVFPGREFARWLANRARELGMRSFLPTEARSLLASGRLRALGDVEVQYGRADRSGRSTLSRIAYLRGTYPESGVGDDSWRMEVEGREARVLLEALRTVYDAMIFADERVHQCMGNVDVTAVERWVQLRCVGDVLAVEWDDH